MIPAYQKAYGHIKEAYSLLCVCYLLIDRTCNERKGEDAPAVRLIAAGLQVNCRGATGEYACCKVKVTAFA